MPTNRRELLSLTSLALLASQPLLLRSAWAKAPRPSFDLFASGVASGCPEPDGFVLWTRLFPDTDASGGIDSAAMSAASIGEYKKVNWEVAHDTRFRHIAQKGSAPALRQLGHAVHVEVNGLEPDRWYFYRFICDGNASAVGRTRTAPMPDRMPEALRFVFASCQHWEDGFYAAWRHVAAEHPDLVVFLGDYIYEGGSSRSSDRIVARLHGLRRAQTLADYRSRYALYKSDPDLQAAHRACPWIVTWDDHEVANDYADETVFPPETGFPERRAAAYQAFYENMPLRSSALVHGMAGLGRAADAVRVTQRHAFGKLARFHVLDTRQFRDVQACRDESRSSSGVVRPADCPALAAPNRTLLGPAQERWLADGLRADTQDGPAAHAGIRWSILAQQTLFTPRAYGKPETGPVATDTWDGYPAARQRLLATLAQTQPRNTVFLGGDIHQNFVCDVHAHPDDPASPLLASEFCGTSITSISGSSQKRLDRLVAQNPYIHLANSRYRGYGSVNLTPTRWTTELRVVDDPQRADSGLSTLAQFVVEDQRPGVSPA